MPSLDDGTRGRARIRPIPGQFQIRNGAWPILPSGIDQNRVHRIVQTGRELRYYSKCLLSPKSGSGRYRHHFSTKKESRKINSKF